MGDADVVEVDFAKVRNISYSFADEFVGELLERVANGAYTCRVTLVHLSPNAERVIAGSLERRGVEPSVLPV